MLTPTSFNSYLQVPSGQRASVKSHYQRDPSFSDDGDTVQFSGNRVRKFIASPLISMALAVMSSPVAYTERTAQVSPVAANVRTLIGHTEDFHIDFRTLDLGSIEDSPAFPDLQKMAEEMYQKGINRRKISQEFGYVMPGSDRFSIGGVIIRLTGDLVITGNSWKLLKGQLSALPDLVDYDLKGEGTHRAGFTEFATGVFDVVTPWKSKYWYKFDGKQPYNAKGTVLPVFSAAPQQS